MSIILVFKEDVKYKNTSATVKYEPAIENLGNWVNYVSEYQALIALNRFKDRVISDVAISSNSQHAIQKLKSLDFRKFLKEANEDTLTTY